MKARFFLLFLHCMMVSMPQSAAAEKTLFRFGIVVPATDGVTETAELREMLDELEEKKLAFVVAGGIKSSGDACTDELYKERQELFEDMKIPLIPFLTASDWTQCVNSGGKSASVERLTRVREMFFSEAASFGDSRIELVRQSIVPQFRSYGENSRWRYRNLLFATIHLPANNNNYVAQAGRNNEFEDRLIANREWLQKLVLLAKRKRLDGIVLFSDGDPIARPTEDNAEKLKTGRDGFQEIRQQLAKLASGFPGKILIIHRQAASHSLATQSEKRIQWNRNVGEVGVAAGIAHISVTTSPSLFGFTQDREQAVAATGTNP